MPALSCRSKVVIRSASVSKGGLRTLLLNSGDQITKIYQGHAVHGRGGQRNRQLGADSSGVETTRYKTVTRPFKREKNFVEVARKTYLKYHITAVLDLRIILESEITASSVNDIAMLPVVLGKMKR